MINETLTMIPGPTPVHPRILDALSRPTVSHVAPSFVETFKKALADFRTLCQSESAQPLIVAGGGTLSMEIALVNLVAPGERVLVLSHGYFGDRWIDLATAFGIEVDAVKAEWGKTVAPEQLAAKLAAGKYAAVTITHVDTSTGTASPVDAYVEVLKGRDELVILDGVCATGGMDEPFDRWGIDVILTGAQKAIAAPPGLALDLFSARAVAKRKSRASVPAYYGDLLRWLPVMDDPSKYFATPCVNEIISFGEALRIALEEGLPARFARHARNAKAFRAGLAALGLPIFTDASALADTLSVVRYPAGVEDLPFRKQMASRGVVIAGCLGPIAGKAFRLGHMGNIGPAEVLSVLQAIGESLAAVGFAVEPSAGVAAAAPVLTASAVLTAV